METDNEDIINRWIVYQNSNSSKVIYNDILDINKINWRS